MKKNKVPDGYSVIAIEDNSLRLATTNFCLVGTESPRQIEYDGEAYSMGPLELIPERLVSSVCSNRTYYKNNKVYCSGCNETSKHHKKAGVYSKKVMTCPKCGEEYSLDCRTDKEPTLISTDNTRRVAQWVDDRRSGEMIECRDYTKQYLGLPPRVSQKELDAICDMFNKYILNKNECMCNSMGEILLTIK